jgi:hypothetical protein
LRFASPVSYFIERSLLEDKNKIRRYCLPRSESVSPR